MLALFAMHCSHAAVPTKPASSVTPTALSTTAGSTGRRDSGLADRPRPAYRPHVFAGNLWLVSQQKPRREWSPPQVISHIGCLDLMDRGATCVPAWLREDGLGTDETGFQRRPNLSSAARRYLDSLGLGVEDLFHHVLAVLHDPAYRQANAGALRMEWPRIPLPGWRDPSSSSGRCCPTYPIRRPRT